ncbi:RsmB/NOP family class I SAM-dependent RNA methyltransferase [Ruicaihuangia caeni]|uniref:RsmB/NOP family class I SAM-dependent RNA methyltransferase n=1 Tax=Ruicaihuangia caeni TaxID=3042517 RepID=UPI0030EF9A95
MTDSDAYANLLLPPRLARSGLAPNDAAFATELTYGTLRGLGFYDAVIAAASGRPVEKIDAPVLDALRLSAHQLLGMRVGAHAAVDQGVSLARANAGGGAGGFANAVLRRITSLDAAGWRAELLKGVTDPDERLAIEHSHPAWVVRALRQALAAEERVDELEALLNADNAAPRVSLALLPGLPHDDDAVEQPLAAATYSPVGAAAPAGDPARLAAVRHGTARVQDEGSQLAALALSRARPVQPGEHWLDLCAGPGGKAALLAAEAALGGATLTANELVPARAGLVRTALAPFDPAPPVLERDGAELAAEMPDAFDRIMLDAPCTGLGALRRRPEARWRKQPRDVPALTALQSRLLDGAITALKPGGVLAYVTCSPHLAETRFIVDDAVRRAGGKVQRLDTRAVLDGIARHPLDLPVGSNEGEGSHVQLWPHRHGTDAMFIQLLTKSAG